MFHRLVILCCCSVLWGTPVLTMAQERKVQNLPNYYSRLLHFGFSLGLNNADFIITPVPDFYKRDSLKVVQSTPQSGFSLGIISDLRLTEYISLRFVPDLTFSQRNLDFYFEGKRDTITKTKVIESTFLNFPLNIKLRSARLNNFGAYVVGGAKYSFDLASQKDVKNNSPEDAVIKLAKHDFLYEGGGGVEFYFPYFKLAIEAKIAIGFRNLLIQDDPLFSQAIDKLNSKVFLFSITFEG